MTTADPGVPRAATYGLYQELPPFDSGWKPFPHHYLLYASAGAFHLDVARMHWLLPPQRAAWVAAGVPIRIAGRTAVTCCSVIFAPGALAPPVDTCRVFEVSPLAREMIRYAMRYGADRDPADAAAERYFRVLADVCLELAAQPDRFWLPRGQSPELQAALDYTLARLEEPVAFAEVARAVAVSQRTLARRFAGELAMTWRQFTQRARMIRAAELLVESSSPVSEVALAAGFSSLSAFTTAFRQFAGAAPRDFRQRHARP
jgi:AraC-like DNA-binding protein